MRNEQKEKEDELAAARSEQAKARTSVLQLEKKIKRSDKAIEAKVHRSILALCLKDH